MIDGEHYPPVTAAALASLAGEGPVLAALLVGGTEKLGTEAAGALAGVPLRRGSDAAVLLASAITELAPDEIVDLSDEPVLDYRRRHELAAVALVHGVSYRGADFRFTPPERPNVARKPSIAIAGTGKRTGKTAVTAFAARHLDSHGIAPVIVAMGRGGPEEPEVLRGDRLSLQVSDLVAWADAGRHAASDYIEDALLARVPTVGCRRCGGGLAGGVAFSNVAAGVSVANDLPGQIMLLEGSGAAIPPVHADVTGLVVPASIPEEYLSGYLGPYRVLLSDFVVVTMCENPFGSPSQISALAARIHSSLRSVRAQRSLEEIRVVRTVFRPTPTRSVEGATALVATTAPETARGSIRAHLESQGCKVAGIVHSLSDRSKLHEELRASQGGADILLCEIKAAGIDVAARWALDAGLEVVFMDNVPQGIDGDDPAAVVSWAAELADKRFEEA